MAQAAHAHDHSHDGHGHGGGGHHGAHHGPMYYVKIWALLLVLLIVSILGPMLGHKIVTIITAFGIAIIKATIVAAFFMHLNVEKRYIWYMLFTMLGFVALFYFGVTSDVGHLTGRNWTKPAAEAHIKDHNAHRGEGEHGGAPAAGEAPAPAAAGEQK